MRIGFVLVVAPLVLGACAGSGPASPPALAYGLPQPATVRYQTGDTALMDIDAGGQNMQATVSSGATFGTTFARAPEGVRVTLTVEDLDARVSSPAGSASADESGIGGPVVFDLDRRGGATVVSQPTVTGPTGEFFQPLSLAHGFFPRLPGRAAALGESWTDTIRVEGEQGEGSLDQTTVATYTVAGDTLVRGRSMVRIDVTGTVRTSSRGVTMGMDFTQNLNGTVRGWVLWDQGRGLLVESYTETDGRGSMEVAMAPFPLGVRMRGQSRVRLLEGS